MSNCFACIALLLRTAETVFRRTKICQYYQHHHMFTKPPKLGHLGARSLKNDSPTLYYLSWDFTLPLVSYSPLSVILPLSFYLSRSPICPPVLQSCGWDGEKMKAERQGAATECFHLLSAELFYHGGDTVSGCSDAARHPHCASQFFLSS